MNNWKPIVAVCLIFAGGVFTGAVLATKLKPGRLRPAQNGFQQPFAAPARIEVVRAMTRQLELSPAQNAKVEKILQDAKERVKTRMETVRPAIRQDMARMRREIDSELTPEQRSKFQAMVAARLGRQTTNNPPAELPKPAASAQ